jgi:adenylate cyclase
VVSVQQAAWDFGVQFILKDSIRSAGSRVRITGQLVDGQTGEHLWAERYDRDLTDIFAIQDEITQAIVDQLKIKLLPQQKAAIGRISTDSIEAYTYCLRVRQFAHEWTKPYLLLARRMFCTAVELDPQYAGAYAGIANCDAALYAWHAAEVSLEDIREKSTKALALDPDLVEAHAVRGLALHQDHRHAEAEAAFEQALALDASSYEANFFYARLLYGQGRLEEAVALFERASALRPHDYVSPVHLMALFRALNRPAERERWARVEVERAERALELHPENSGPAHRGALALAHLGRADQAKAWAARAMAIDPDESVANYNLACMYELQGESDRAMDHLEKVVPYTRPS